MLSVDIHEFPGCLEEKILLVNVNILEGILVKKMNQERSVALRETINVQYVSVFPLLNHSFFYHLLNLLNIKSKLVNLNRLLI